MVAEKKKTRLYLVLIVLVLALIAALLGWHAAHRPEKELPAVTPRPTPEVIVQETQVEKLVEIEKEITVDTIRDGLRHIGLLVTQEYYFTDVITYSSIKKLFNVEVGFTESSYVATYDGVVTAGIDFASVDVEKDDEAGTVRVRLPAAQILNVDIDPESFVLHSEKAGFANPVSVEDFNNSLVTLENSAREKAVDKGLLVRAEENARTVVENFIAGLLDPSRYTVEFVE